jgi:hypothetical protein
MCAVGTGTERPRSSPVVRYQVSGDHEPVDLKTFLREIYCQTGNHCTKETSWTSGVLWVTATGANYTLACSGHPGLHCPAGQCRAAAFIMRFANVDPRTTRVYFHTVMDGSSPASGDDTGLVARGRPHRPPGPYSVLRAHSTSCRISADFTRPPPPRISADFAPAAAAASLPISPPAAAAAASLPISPPPPLHLCRFHRRRCRISADFTRPRRRRRLSADFTPAAAAASLPISPAAAAAASLPISPAAAAAHLWRFHPAPPPRTSGEFTRRRASASRVRRE